MLLGVVQVDNQLPKAEARVILGPTPVQVSQPTNHFCAANRHAAATCFHASGVRVKQLWLW